MKEKYTFDEIEVGLELGPWEVSVTPDAVEDYRQTARGDAGQGVGGEVPPGLFIGDHVRVLTKALGGAGSRIWAKSEHEFVNPMKTGTKLVKRGRVADKYVKRGKQYLVYQLDTVDEEGRLIMRSRETSFFGEVPEGKT